MLSKASHSAICMAIDMVQHIIAFGFKSPKAVVGFAKKQVIAGCSLILKFYRRSLQKVQMKTYSFIIFSYFFV